MIAVNFQEQKNKLYALKNELGMDVYYQVDIEHFTVPAIRNRVNFPSVLTGKNKWTGFTNYLVVDKDNPDHYRLYLLWQDDMTPIFSKVDIPQDEVMYWLKQFYSAAKIILREMDHDPKDVDDIKNQSVYHDRWAKLKVKAQFSHKNDTEDPDL